MALSGGLTAPSFPTQQALDQPQQLIGKNRLLKEDGARRQLVPAGSCASGDYEDRKRRLVLGKDLGQAGPIHLAGKPDVGDQQQEIPGALDQRVALDGISRFGDPISLVAQDLGELLPDHRLVLDQEDVRREIVQGCLAFGPLRTFGHSGMRPKPALCCCRSECLGSTCYHSSAGTDRS